MSFKTLVYAYVLGGFTFLPLLLCAAVAWTIYTSVPVGDTDPAKLERKRLSDKSNQEEREEAPAPAVGVSDQPKPRKGWLTVRRTFEEKETDGSYVNMMRSFLDSRSKDPKRSRPKDMWYVVLKGNVLYLYEDEAMTECEAAIQVSLHEVVVYPEGLMDGELFTKRNAICLKPLKSGTEKEMASVTKEMELKDENVTKKLEELDLNESRKQKQRERLEEVERVKANARNEAFDFTTPWFIFIRSCVEMEDWYLALVYAANYSSCSSSFEPVRPVFLPSDMDYLVSTLDEQPDVIPMRWLNALLGRIFFSFYRTQNLESFIIGRLMKKLSKVKTPSFLQNIAVTEVSVGNTPPTFSKPMLKELTKEGDAALEIRVMYRGEIRLTVEATAIINLGQRFKTYTVKLVLAVVLRKLDGNLLVKVKRPPTNRIWYAFTHPPEMVLDVEPVVSDRQIKWGMICSTIESRLKEIINESVVLPNMDDIAFFETSQYQHRGGIWADASRKEHVVTDLPDDSTVLKSPASNADADALQKSQSASAIPISESSTSSDSGPDAGITRVSTIAAPESTSATKRESWSARSPGALDDEVGDDQETRSDQLAIPDDERGRSTNVEANGRRATSVPASKTASMEDLESAEQQTILSSDSPDSPTSQDPAHSRMRSLSSGAPVLAPETNASRESLISRGSSLANTSSFLSTLKSKADKQALSNTAKEAMRKWSANWSGFKRDHVNGSNNSEESADGVSQGSNTFFSFPTKGRNYADIRNAVSGRRDRDSISSEERPEWSSSPPIDIPTKRDVEENSGERVRSVSSVSVKDQDEVTPSSSQATASQQSSPRGPSLLRKESGRAAPSPPRVTTETQSTDNSTPYAQQQPALSIIHPVEPSISAPPIKTQPSQGAMMTIPGIHVSHRGDVMSYGYVPPVLSAPATLENKSRTPTIAPTIQSMYRLFRSPTSGATDLQQQQQQASAMREHAAESAEGPRVADTEEPSQQVPEANDDVAPLSLSPAMPTISQNNTQASSRPAPPPLPPRSISSPAPPLPVRREADQSSTLENTSSISPSASSASEVLKLIAEHDETKRRDLEVSIASSEPQAKPSRTKRNSLGARRITSIVVSEELEPLYEGSSSGSPHRAVQPHRGNSVTPQRQGQEAGDYITSDSGSFSENSAVAPETAPASVRSPVASNGAKPSPPPLPPRRPSFTVPS
ncbi:hypothetical protein DFH11DRAFT_1557516 [Phellopilus nigrolimitatus]|nr:hypothetical protein DFH11DRAFT_1557516 [Phellopilus nigrolimitatus]